jgi:hypothetical protein
MVERLAGSSAYHETGTRGFENALAPLAAAPSIDDHLPAGDRG